MSLKICPNNISLDSCLWLNSVIYPLKGHCLNIGGTWNDGVQFKQL